MKFASSWRPICRWIISVPTLRPTLPLFGCETSSPIGVFLGHAFLSFYLVPQHRGWDHRQPTQLKRWPTSESSKQVEAVVYQELIYEFKSDIWGCLPIEQPHVLCHIPWSCCFFPLETIMDSKCMHSSGCVYESQGSGLSFVCAFEQKNTWFERFLVQLSIYFNNRVFNMYCCEVGVELSPHWGTENNLKRDFINSMTRPVLGPR